VSSSHDQPASTPYSEDIELLLAGLKVESIAELKRLVDAARAAEDLLADLHAVSSMPSRGAAERQPHGCEDNSNKVTSIPAPAAPQP
jgi:hypothetical protein